MANEKQLSYDELKARLEAAEAALRKGDGEITVRLTRDRAKVHVGGEGMGWGFTFRPEQARKVFTDPSIGQKILALAKTIG